MPRAARWTASRSISIRAFCRKLRRAAAGRRRRRWCWRSPPSSPRPGRCGCAPTAVLAARVVEPFGAGRRRGDMSEIVDHLIERARIDGDRRRQCTDAWRRSRNWCAGAPPSGRLRRRRRRAWPRRAAAGSSAADGAWRARCRRRAGDPPDRRNPAFTSARAAIGRSPSNWKASDAFRNWDEPGTQLEMGGNDQRITLGNAGSLHDAHLERRRR